MYLFQWKIIFLYIYILGVSNYQVEEDIGKLKSCLTSFLQEYGLSVMVKDDYVHELWVFFFREHMRQYCCVIWLICFLVTILSCSCRYGAAEPHTIAAFLGGKFQRQKTITCCYIVQLWSFVFLAVLTKEVSVAHLVSLLSISPTAVLKHN